MPPPASRPASSRLEVVGDAAVLLAGLAAGDRDERVADPARAAVGGAPAEGMDCVEGRIGVAARRSQRRRVGAQRRDRRGVAGKEQRQPGEHRAAALGRPDHRDEGVGAGDGEAGRVLGDDVRLPSPGQLEADGEAADVRCPVGLVGIAAAVREAGDDADPLSLHVRRGGQGAGLGRGDEGARADDATGVQRATAAVHAEAGGDLLDRLLRTDHAADPIRDRSGRYGRAAVDFARRGIACARVTSGEEAAEEARGARHLRRGEHGLEAGPGGYLPKVGTRADEGGQHQRRRPRPARRAAARGSSRVLRYEVRSDDHTVTRHLTARDYEGAGVDRLRALSLLRRRRPHRPYPRTPRSARSTTSACGSPRASTRAGSSS